MSATKTTSSGKRIGYVRVSSVDQNDARQLEGLVVDKTFADKASGKDTNRPQLQAMFEFVREGDHIYVHSMDRLSRSLRDLQEVVERLTSKGISVTFVKETLTFEPPATGADAHKTAYSTLMFPDGHFKFPHLWPVKLPQAGRVNYQSFDVSRAMRAAASFNR